MSTSAPLEASLRTATPVARRDTLPGSRAGGHDLVVVANRLPVERHGERWRASPGGLVRAMLGVGRERGGAWVGWTGAPDDAPARFQHDDIEIRPVALTAEQIADHYENVSNGAIWPLYHDAIRPSSFDAAAWRTYRQVNLRFAREAASAAGRGATVWVQDYQLQLVPSMLRGMRPDLRIGFFLHIPFPPAELFARMPWRRHVLLGLLGADLIGFQRDSDARNFRHVAEQLVQCTGTDDGLTTDDGRVVRVGTFPVSIDTAEIDEIASRPATRAAAADIRARLGHPDTVLLGVDRLDYTKGIEQRLMAFGSLLAGQPPQPRSGRPRTVLVQLAVPSRENVEDYVSLRRDVEQLVGSINGDHATLGNPAVHYLHDSLPLDELIPLYQAADVMLVTPLRDGMNLVAKEFVASRVDGGGRLVLSEFAGAADQLTGAVTVNPHDPGSMLAALDAAVTMPDADAAARMASMRRSVQLHDARRWATEFLDRLEP